MNTKEQIKFTFNEELQEEILQFAVTDLKSGFKAVELFESYFFQRVEHMVIAEVLKKYYNNRYSVPSQAILLEEVKSLLRNRQWKQYVTTQDKTAITKLIKKLYKRPVKNPDDIYEACRNFARMRAVQGVIENFDVYNFESYRDLETEIQKATSIGTELYQDKGTFVLADAKSRITKRRDAPPGYPTPWWQLNALMNSGGTNKGNIIVVLGPAKRFKTGFILNTARGYLKKGKNFLVFDLENGEDALSMRTDQSLINVDRKTLLSGGEIDEKLLKKIRLYKRFGGELIIKRLPAGSTTKDMAAYIDWLRQAHNITVHHMAVDYPDVMGDTLKTSDETRRIGQVYIDLKNLADEFEIGSIWCPSHVNREGDKAQDKKFKATDSSKAIDKVRHADVILGIQQSEEEKAADIVRLEVVDQRDGVGEGRIFLHGNLSTQTVKEFSKAQVKEIEEIYRETESTGKSGGLPSNKPKKEVSDL